VSGVVVIDTNLLLLRVVGAAGRRYISSHPKLDHFTEYDFDLLELLIGDFAEIVLLPQIIAEVSNLAAYIYKPARREVFRALQRLVEGCIELPVSSRDAASRHEFSRLGVADAAILYLCAMRIDGSQPTLLTADGVLADAAHSQSYSVIDYKQQYQGK
jgi:hypothetical protein